jgi:PRC-barrel domain
MKKLLATASVVALMALPALAQDATAPAVEKAPAEKSAVLDASDVSAKALLTESVKNAANETIGDINDVLISGDGKVSAVIVGVGGFLGMGEKDVALPYDQLVFAKDVGDDLVVTTSATKESLETAPEYIKPEDRS